MITLASFLSFSNNSSTLSTITPAALSGGGETFKVSILGEGSTLSSSGVKVSKGWVVITKKYWQRKKKLILFYSFF